MSLILATGSNLGNRIENLKNAQDELSANFSFLAASKIYQSAAVDYLNQPDFYNQVLEFEIPNLDPIDLLRRLQIIEANLGRRRTVPKGPRIIDIDIIFLGDQKIFLPNLIIPHQSWQQRDFVLAPLQDIPFYKILCHKNYFSLPLREPFAAQPIIALS